jgi:hypothetical protein
LSSATDPIFLKPDKHFLRGISCCFPVQKQTVCKAKDPALMQRHKPFERLSLTGLCSTNELAQQVRLEHESVKGRYRYLHAPFLTPHLLYVPV